MSKAQHEISRQNEKGLSENDAAHAQMLQPLFSFNIENKWGRINYGMLFRKVFQLVFHMKNRIYINHKNQ